MMQKKLPIGIEDFEEIRTEGFYYVDKTGLIRELLNNWGKVNLFTRPRRFGKSLNMSMLKYYLETGSDKELFEGLEIMEEKDLCEEFMGKFPVISISLKGISGENYKSARSMMCSAIGKEAMRFHFLADSERLNDTEKNLYGQLTLVDRHGKQMFCMPDAVLVKSLKTLSMLLRKHFGRKVIILIDEYDVPLEKAFDRGYYDQMVVLVRNMFGQALKTNDSLYFAVLTGCLRISKESIFTGLNNMKVLAVTDVERGEYFGFTDKEVRELLEYYNVFASYDTVKEWYDGYQFGYEHMYCPWDVICYSNALRADAEANPGNYWSNTSGNEVVKKFIGKSDMGIAKREIERLVAGEAIEKEICQELTYKELYDSVDNIWSVLFTTGYLTQRGKSKGDAMKLAIPNLEIRKIFVMQIMEYFKQAARQDGTALYAFCHAFENGDAESVEKQFNAYLKKTISIRDTFVKKSAKENFYHGILLGLLSFKETWEISSNKESGEGYSDILVEIDDEEIGIVIEVKYSDNGNLEAGCKAALHQIEEKQYEELLRETGMRTILKYGIACYQKRCKVSIVKEEPKE